MSTSLNSTDSTVNVQLLNGKKPLKYLAIRKYILFSSIQGELSNSMDKDANGSKHDLRKLKNKVSFICVIS